jgi:hypothetical protein
LEHRSDAARAAIEAERVVRKHQATVGAQERVVTKMIETGQFDNSEKCGGRSGRGYIGRTDRRVIEYHSDSD